MCLVRVLKKTNLRVSETLEQTQQSGHVPCPQSFPTSWHCAGLGINRGARCAPRMHVCRVPISEYTVIGLPEGLYLTFRLQVAGHSKAHSSCASTINPLLYPFNQHKPTCCLLEYWVVKLLFPKSNVNFQHQILNETQMRSPLNDQKIPTSRIPLGLCVTGSLFVTYISLTQVRQFHKNKDWQIQSP